MKTVSSLLLFLAFVTSFQTSFALTPAADSQVVPFSFIRVEQFSDQDCEPGKNFSVSVKKAENNSLNISTDQNVYNFVSVENNWSVKGVDYMTHVNRFDGFRPQGYAFALATLQKNDPRDVQSAYFIERARLIESQLTFKTDPITKKKITQVVCRWHYHYEPDGDA